MAKIPANFGIIGTSAAVLFGKIAIDVAKFSAQGLKWSESGGILQRILLGKGTKNVDTGLIEGRAGGLKGFLNSFKETGKAIKNVTETYQIYKNAIKSGQPVENALTLVREYSIGLDRKGIIQKHLLTAATEGQTLTTWHLVKAQLAAAASNPATWIMLAVGAFALLAKVIETPAERLERLDKQLDETKQRIEEINQEKESLEDLTKQFEELSKAGEDTADIRKQIQEQFGEQLKGIDTETASYQKLTDALEEYNVELLKQLAIEQNSKFLTEQESREAEIDKSLEDYKKIEVIADEYSEYATTYIYYEIDGERFEDVDSARKYLEEKIETVSPSATQAKANAAVISYELKINDNSVTDFLSNVIQKIENFDQYIDKETGKISANTLAAFENIANDYSILSDKFKGEISNLFNGDIFYSQLTEGQKAFLEGLDTFGNDLVLKFKEIEQAAESNYINSRTALDNSLNSLEARQKFEVKNLIYGSDFDSLSVQVRQAFITAASDLVDDPEALSAFQNAFQQLISSGVNPDSITQEMVAALASSEAMEGAYSNLLSGLGEMPSDLDADSQKFFEVLKNSLEDTTVAFLEGKKALDSYKEAFASFEELKSGSVDDDMFIESLDILASQYAELTGRTIESTKAILYSAIARNDNNALILKETDDLKLLQEEVKTASNNQIEASKVNLEAKATELEAIADNIEGVTSLSQSNIEEQKTSGFAAWAITQFGEQAYWAWEAAQGNKEAINNLKGFSNEAKKGALKIADSYEMFASGDISAENIAAMAQDLRDKAAILRGKAAMLTLGDFSSSESGGGGGSSSSDDSTKAYIQSLKDLADRLKEAADAAKDSAETQIEAILSVLNFQKESLKKQNDDLKETLEEQQNLLKLQLSAWKDYLQEQLDEMEKANEKMREELNFQAQVAGDAYQLQIDAIQAKIDALDEEAEAEDRILNLQKARDEYERAKSRRTRLVLVEGAGWIFKSDQNEISEARKALKEVEREYKKAELQEQIEALEQQAEEWEKVAGNIEKNAEEVEKLNKAIEKFNSLTDEGRQNLLNIFRDDVDAAMKDNANLEYNQDEEREGSLANQINKIEEAIKEATQSYEDYLNNIQMEKFLNGFLGELTKGNKTSQEITGELLDAVKNFVDGDGSNTLKSISEQISQNEKQIELTESTINLWTELKDNLGLSLEEISGAQELFNKYSSMQLNELGEQSVLFTQMSSQINQVIAGMYSDYNKAQANYEAADKSYSSGGIIDYYGKANVHGAPNSTEVVFNAAQAQALFSWVKGLPTVERKGFSSISRGNTSSASYNNGFYVDNLYIQSNANSVEQLVTDIRRNSPLVRKK